MFELYAMSYQSYMPSHVRLASEIFFSNLLEVKISYDRASQ